MEDDNFSDDDDVEDIEDITSSLFEEVNVTGSFHSITLDQLRNIRTNNKYITYSFEHV